MKARSLLLKLVLIVFLGCTASCLWGQDGIEGALPRINSGSPSSLTVPFKQTLAVADFDNDHKLDGAVLADSGRLHGQSSYRIELHLSGSNNSELTFQSTETALAITASDINNDGKPDVVIERPVSHKRLYVWLNDGHGGFHKGRVEDFPSTGAGSGKRAEAPTRQTDCPALCLPQRRGTETTILASSFLRARPPSASKIAAFPLVAFPAWTGFAPDSSRAPPLLAL